MSEVENQEYYLEQLHDQVSFLIDACHSYDRGNFKQAKIISSLIRTIVKDPASNGRKSRTTSLLTHIGKKPSIKMYNTGFEAKNARINFNLVGIATVPTSKKFFKKRFNHIYLPLLDESQIVDVKWLSFEEWWNSNIFVYDSRDLTNIFTRKRIVLTMAEQDGGSHVDSHEDIDKEYLDLATAAKIYITNVDCEGNESPFVNMHYALVRQIGHELLISLMQEFKFPLSYKPTNKINLRGVPKHKIKQPGILVAGKKIESTRTANPIKGVEKVSFKNPFYKPPLQQ
ncbi:hypothetical protein AUC31_17570 [Planococcus rifietoensis]|uniref:Uncharacterized protein n=1 Tax=Planococcus rifietoensis TaxID=200991 RepID=A0A0U2QCF9_9BACL|nr:hypothetical protein [Planococcus rifietoensis]ALS76918.1 hypothetical protein AUC31_17570 [Planococcus rifietoensis]